MVAPSPLGAPLRSSVSRTHSMRGLENSAMLRGFGHGSPGALRGIGVTVRASASADRERWVSALLEDRAVRVGVSGQLSSVSKPTLDLSAPVLGQGAYGRVLATRTFGGHSSATKIIETRGPEDSLRWLEGEARIHFRAAAREGHAFILRPLEAYATQDRFVLVLERAESNLVRSSRCFTPREALRGLSAVADAALHLARLGIVHDDLCPQNIFVVPGSDGDP